MATITVAADSLTGEGGGEVLLSVSVVQFANDYYNSYSTGGTGTVIKTQVTVSGRASGAAVTQEYAIE